MLVQMLPFSRRGVITALTAAVLCAIAGHGAFAQSDPLPSWNDGAVKNSITDFVARVTRKGGGDYVKPEERIATFDNDGTLWAEQPIYFQLVFALDRAKATASRDPELRKRDVFKALQARQGARRGHREGMDHRRHEAGLEDHLSIRKVAREATMSNKSTTLLRNLGTPAGDCWHHRPRQHGGRAESSVASTKRLALSLPAA